MYHRDADICDTLRASAVAGPRGIIRTTLASPRAPLLVPFALEMFAGSGKFSRAVAALGYMVIALDWGFGPDHNLARQKTLDMVLGWIQAGWVAFVLLAPPCQSWSRAQCRPGGPQMLTSNKFLDGLSELRYESERWKIVSGNKTMKSTVRVGLACLRNKVPFVIESPRTSMIWLSTEMANPKNRRDCRFFQSDFCLWGWRGEKAAGLLAGFCNPARVERICQNATCKRTGERHTALAGIDPVSKCFWTHIAEAYPRALSTSLAKMLHEGRMQLDHLDHSQRLMF